MSSISNLYIYSFYRFVSVNKKIELKNILLKSPNEQKLRGTILIADEGINGTISGRKNDIINLLKIIRKKLKIRKLETFS